jgi:ATP-dependent DNA helicase RecG
VVTLSDRLDYIVGADAAGPLDEVFSVRTVDDLLRHYPRSYVEGAAVREADDERPTAGEHITLVDTITSARMRPMTKRKGEYLVITVGRGRNKVSATFFHAKGLKWKLTRNTKVMLSGEVGFFKGTMQLTHPDFLILDSPRKENFGSDSLRNIADASQAVSGEVVQSEFERSCYPIYPASTKLQSWDIFNCVRQVLEVLDAVADPLPEAWRVEHGLISEDEALRAIHLAESPAARQRARERLTFDEAVGLQWALAGRRHGELSESGPPAPPSADGLA